MTRVTLGAPRAADQPDLDEFQTATLSFVSSNPGKHVLVVGTPGSGKSTLAVALAADAVPARLRPEGVLVLTQTRASADRLRDRVSAAMGVPTEGPTVRSAASFGWSILRAAAIAAGEPAPILVTGAEQDEILRDLLEGHRVGRAPGPSWEGVVVQEATELAGFRHELRDLLMRAEESDLGPDELGRMGERCGRAEWVAAAQVFREYERNLALRRTSPDQGARYDPAGMVSAAADALAGWSGRGIRQGWNLVIVDDAQDATRATWRLVLTLARAGAQVVLIGNADEAVQGYRGAAPHVLAGAVKAAPEGLGATVIRLGPPHRQVGALAETSRQIAEHIGMAQDFSARPAPGNPDSPDDKGGEVGIDEDGGDSGVEEAVTVIVSPSVGVEVRALAARLNEFHRGVGGPSVPWSEVAVIARTRARLREIRGGLLAEGIPCAALGEGVALHLEPSVVPLIRLARVALGEQWTGESARVVLGSRAVGLDGRGLRRLLRLILAEERAGGGTRTGDALLVDALSDPVRLATIPGPEAARATLVARAAEDGRAVARAGGAPTASVLWAIWTRLGVAEVWRDSALAGSAIDDADLDAVMALFEAAKRHAERLPDSQPGAFFDYLEAQSFAVDTLAARGALRETISLETPASAAGREWDVVALAGLEEGVWPNLRLRDSILGSAFLAEVLAGRVAEEPIPRERLAEASHAARSDVLNDEARAFLVAFTRARRSVIALTRDGGDDRPSRFTAWIDGSDHRRRRAGEFSGISSLREAVVALRAEAIALTSDERRGHVSALAHLAVAGVPGADPRNWFGVPEPSSTEPLWREEETVRVSPSRVEGIESCPLKAVLESAGGRRESGQAQKLGVAVHAIAAEHPDGTREELVAGLLERWPELGLPPNWLERQEWSRAEAMVGRLADYIEKTRDEGWEVEVERPFRLDLDRARLSGRADRLHVKDGEARVVDLKTSKNAITKKEAQANPQLAMYQLAAERGGFQGVTGTAGAELVYLGTTGDPVRVQDRVDGEEAGRRLDEIVTTLSSATFDAVVGDGCRNCPVKRACPAWPQGGRVSAP